MTQKLKSQRGESISEVLVALLISTIGILLLAMMIGASSRIIMKSKADLNNYYLRNNCLETHTRNPGDEEKDAEATIQFGDSPSDNKTITVIYYTNNQGGKQVISYTEKKVATP